MVDSVVTFALENLNQLLKREASLLCGVEEEIKSLHLKLTLINQFLHNSKGKREMVKELLITIRSVAHRAEDVIDTYVVNVEKNNRRSKAGKVLRVCKHAFMLRSVATEINSITDEITKIYNNKDQYGIENKEAGDDFREKRKDLDRRRCQVEEEQVVSFVNDAKIVMGMLTKTGRHLDVVSVVGMGGLGKTTLAKKIFNDNLTKNHFDCCAWVYVSQEFRTRDLLLNILLSLGLSTDEVHAMNETMLVEELRKFLADKKYLIVLDDVWTTQVWDGVKSAFPENRKGCRILVTSRVNEVAAHASKRAPYYLPLLNKDDSWELLWRKAFRGEVCPLELEMPGRQIADKCNGLPLAIVVVAGLLATRDKTSRIWSKMADNISWYLKSDPEKFIDILALSYEELPSYLKPCFLYMGLFPEDFEVTVRQLIRLWIAEGFIKHDKTRKIEEVAEEYVEELVDRSLIMVVRRRSDGGIKSICIHDMLRDLCISKADEENVLTVHTDQVLSSSSNISSDSPFPENPRRLSVHCSASRYISHAPPNTSMVRSFLCFGEPDELNIKTFQGLYKGFRLLRVLDLGSTIVLTIPTQVEKLIHLRYLKMNAPRLSEFPSPISNLPNLQTLDLKESKIRYFNNSFWKMQQLRHLFLGGDCDIPVMQRRTYIKIMRNLQTLSTISSNVAYSLHGDTLFPNLRKLGVRASERCSYLQVTKGRPKFTSVQTLKITEGSHFLSQQGAFTSNLSKLTLIQTKIGCSAFQRLALLPNLQILKLLKKSLVGPVIECGKGWFLKLEVLHMEELDVVKWVLNDNITHPVSKMSPQILSLRKEIEDMRQIINNRHEEVGEKIQVTNTEKEKFKVSRRNLDDLQDALERQRKLVSESLHYRDQKLELDHQMEKLWLCQKQLNDSEKELAEFKKKLTESEEKLMKAMEPKTLPNLQYLFITKCRDLKEVSGPLKQATTLSHVKVSWCSLVLEGNLRKILGKRVKFEFHSYNS